MSSPRTTIVVAVLALVALVAVRHARARVQSAQDTGPRITKAVRDASFRFDSSVSPADRQLVAHEIELARPEARRLIGIVDGLVTISVGSAGDGGQDAVGLTQGTPDGFHVTLDLARVWQGTGERGVQRLVLHELGHVVDGALVKPDLAARLDALIPRGYACSPGDVTSGCAPREERFAETFAKWCNGDIGFNLPVGFGYRVEPPPSLDDWGAQLVSGIGAA